MSKIKPYSFFNISEYRSEIYGISVLWIMLYHSEAIYAPWLQTFLGYGNMGCELFIFISGVCMYFAYRSKKSVCSFTKKRLLRILIPLWTIYMWEWLYLCIIGKMSVLNFISRIFSLRFWLTGDDQGWFVAFIMMAYLIYPYIYNILYEKEKSNVLIRTLVLLFCSLLLLQMMVYFMFIYYNYVEIALTRFPIFILGSAFGKVVYDKKTIQHPLPFYASMLAIVIGSFILLNNVDLGYKIFTRLFYLIPGTALVFLFSKLFEYTKKIYINRFLAFLGSMSLEIYLLHLLLRRLLRFVSWYDRTNHLYYLALLVVSVILSYGISKFDQFLLKKLAR